MLCFKLCRLLLYSLQCLLKDLLKICCSYYGTQWINSVLTWRMKKLTYYCKNIATHSSEIIFFHLTCKRVAYVKFQSLMSSNTWLWEWKKKIVWLQKLITQICNHISLKVDDLGIRNIQTIFSSKFLLKTVPPLIKIYGITV